MRNPKLESRIHTIAAMVCALACLLVAARLPAASEEASVDLEALTSSLRAAEIAFAKSVSDGDMEAFRGTMTEDAVFSGSASALVGKDAIAKVWSAFFQPDGPRISWEPEKVSVHPNGTIGTSQGPFRVERTMADGGTKASTGTFFSVWRHTEEGWKIFMDSGTDTMPVRTPSSWAGAFHGLEWMQGIWTGAGLGGWIEEAWSEPKGGAMIGHFRLVRENEPSFYEIFILREEEGKLVLRLKHFEPDLKGWEEKDETVAFLSLQRGAEHIHFEGLRYSRDGKQGLRIELDFTRKGEKTAEVVLLRRSSF